MPLSPLDWQALEAEKQAQLDKLRRAEEERNNRAAGKIQRAVRGYLKRKAEDDARKAADKKKKGKGGKKKK